jgi:nitric oxide reductase NorQ protein
MPYYVDVADEREVFRAAFAARRPVLLKGPTGVGKTRLVEAMACELGLDLVTVACHEDLTAADLVGRFLLRGEETVWIDGPLTEAVRRGALCYLDEIVEARQDTTVVLHPLTDHRRLLPMERLATAITAHDTFFLVVSYNPGYQSLLKELKPSTRQRFVAIDLGFPPADVETVVVAHEAGVDTAIAGQLVALANALRNSHVSGLRETVSTRALVAAGALSASGLPLARSARAAIAQTLTDDPELIEAIDELIAAYIET